MALLAALSPLARSPVGVLRLAAAHPAPGPCRRERHRGWVLRLSTSALLRRSAHGRPERGLWIALASWRLAALADGVIGVS